MCLGVGVSISLDPECSLGLAASRSSQLVREKAQELSEWIHQLESEKFDLMEKLKQQKYEVRPPCLCWDPGWVRGVSGGALADHLPSLVSCSTDQRAVQPHQPCPEIVSATPNLHLWPLWFPPSLPFPSPFPPPSTSAHHCPFAISCLCFLRHPICTCSCGFTLFISRQSLTR